MITRIGDILGHSHQREFLNTRIDLIYYNLFYFPQHIRESTLQLLTSKSDVKRQIKKLTEASCDSRILATEGVHFTEG